MKRIVHVLGFYRGANPKARTTMISVLNALINATMNVQYSLIIFNVAVLLNKSNQAESLKKWLQKVNFAAKIAEKRKNILES